MMYNYVRIVRYTVCLIFLLTPACSKPAADAKKLNWKPWNGTAARSSQPDIELSRKVRAAIMQDQSLGRNIAHIDVSSKDGFVVLTGFVSSEQDKSALQSLAEQVAGREHVKNDLQVISSGK